jgi:PKD repeat protein
VDSAGNAYVTGSTRSPDFPTANALQPTGENNAFVARLSAAGSALVYSTYLGGSGYESGYISDGLGIAVDSAGNAYVTGTAYSLDFPTVNALQPTMGGGLRDAFVAKIGGTVNQPPVASFTSTCSGLTCDFNGSGSSDSDGTITSYAWNFGDGTTTTGATVSHTYAVAGTYSVTLAVTDSDATSVKSQSVTPVVNAPPVASFTSACSGLTCIFNGAGSSDSDGTITSHAWSFGDGASTSGTTASHTYTGGGTYTVILNVTDNAGAASTQRQDVTVSARMHVGDLDGAVANNGSTWTARATTTIHDGSHRLVGNATVSGFWNDGATGSCTTNGNGQCSASKSGIPKNTASVAFTVINVTHATLTYVSMDNHDPDGDSNGRSITVSRR